MVPFTRPLASWWHLEFWNGLKNWPFSYISFANLLKNFRNNLNYLSLSQVIFKFRNCNSTPKKNHCSQHSIIDFTSSLIIKVPWPFQHMSIEQLINFEIFISWNKIFLKIQYFCSLYFVIWKKFILKFLAFL